MMMPGRQYSIANTGYRYGFNGKENDNDIENGAQDYGMRIYDGRLGRFLSVDPVTKSYPQLTAYQFASDRPIDGVDLDGLEWWSNFKKWLVTPVKAWNTPDGKPPKISPEADKAIREGVTNFTTVALMLQGHFEMQESSVTGAKGAPTASSTISIDKTALTTVAAESRTASEVGATESTIGITNKQSVAANSGNTGAAESNTNTVSLSSTDETQSVKLQPYGGPGGGHHVLAKVAFEGAENYDQNLALSIPNQELSRLNIRHSLITGAQKKAYTEFAASGKTLTWTEMENIETNVLTKAGLNPKISKSLVSKAVENLKKAGVKSPMRIPWGGKYGK